MSGVGLWSERLAWALALCLAYLLLCGAVAWRHHRGARERERARRALQAGSGESGGWTVAWASQTGQAEHIAWQTADTLHRAGLSVHLRELGRLKPVDLANTQRLLLVLSTSGEGDSPDHAAVFVRDTLTHMLDLRHLHVAVLALGDQTYAHYCGFGRQVDGWLQSCGAQPLFERIDVDRLDEAALGRWRQQLAQLVGHTEATTWQAPALTPWVLQARHWLNPGSQGEPVCHLVFVPADGVLPDWQAGDLVQIALPEALAAQVPNDAARPRDYSIASIPGDGSLHLLVRALRHPDGRTGLMSGHLCHTAQTGQVFSLRLREHHAFRIAGNELRPLILIGSGTGMAGLRAHLKARAARHRDRQPAAPCWLVFGERQRAIDFHHADEVAQWQAAGVLARVDAVFSRDHHPRRYLQDQLRDVADTLRDWVEARGAAIYVCGSLQGMAAGVDQVLREALGKPALDALVAEGRYRRDVY